MAERSNQRLGVLVSGDISLGSSISHPVVTTAASFDQAAWGNLTLEPRSLVVCNICEQQQVRRVEAAFAMMAVLGHCNQQTVLRPGATLHL